MASVHPHINFNGNAEEAFNFYKSVFGGEFSKTVRFKDISNEDFKVSEHEAEKIMHIVLPIGNTLLMANDVPEIMGKTNENENRSKIVVVTESVEEAERLYQGLSRDGQIEVPFTGSEDNTYFGMFRDQYGIEWIIEFNPF